MISTVTAVTAIAVITEISAITADPTSRYYDNLNHSSDGHSYLGDHCGTAVTAVQRPRAASPPATVATVTAATSITVITAATAVRAGATAGSLTPDGRAGPLALPAAAGPPQSPPLTRRSPLACQTTCRRWPACRPQAAAAAGLPIAAGPMDRKAVPAGVGRRRQARVEAALSADAAGARLLRRGRPVQPAVDRLRVTASC